MVSENGPMEVTDAQFEKVVLKSEVPVLVDFWAVWCQPCRVIAPYVDELAKEYAGRLLVVKMDTDANMQTPMRLGIMGIPTLILFKGGQEVDRQVGVPRQPKEVLKAKIEKAMGATETGNGSGQGNDAPNRQPGGNKLPTA